jgi:lysophospholipase L1-like esterase
MAAKFSWKRKVPFFILGMYFGGNFSAFRPLYNTLEELEITSRKLITELESKTIDLKFKLQQCQQSAAEAVGLVAKTDSSLSNPNRTPSRLETSNLVPTPTESNAGNNPVCAMLATPFAPSAGSLWMHNLDRIHKASRLPEDKDFSASDFTAQVLQMISPRLPMSVKSLTRERTLVDSIMKKAFARYQYLKQGDHGAASSPPPPVRILVMGGSVTKGVNCFSSIKGVNRFLCAWPNRLENMINQLFGGKLVEVKAVGMGGTNSATGATILEHDLLPADAKNPDIIINSYSTNDMHVITMRQAASGNATLRDKVFDMTQDFVRQALRPQSCKGVQQPLLLHMDDYLGNEQREIWSTTELAQGVNVLANYYGFASISYADMVRDWVYGDTRESLFSPQGWYDGGVFSREIHPGVGAHSTMAWAVAYNLLNLATTQCSMESGSIISYTEQRKLQLLENPEAADIPGKPLPVPKGLPPRLSKELSLEEVSGLWRESSETLVHSESQSSGCQDRCPFSWVGGIDLQQSDAQWIQEYFNGHTTKENGWKLAGGEQKIGFVPVDGKHGSEMTLNFANLTQSIRSVTLFTMKSYGERWKDSRAQVKIWKQSRSHQTWNETDTIELSGFHDKNTSETYTEVIHLSKKVSAGDSLRISTTFVHGGTFKLMGLAICT